MAGSRRTNFLLARRISARASCRPRVTLRSGLRSRKARVERRTSRRSRHGQLWPRRREIGSLVFSRACAAKEPSATITLAAPPRSAEQERLAGRNLVWLRVAVAGRPALEDVGDVDVLPRVAHRLDDLVSNWPARPTKGSPWMVFVGAWGPSPRTSVGGGIADAVDDLLAAEPGQLAPTHSPRSCRMATSASAGGNSCDVFWLAAGTIGSASGGLREVTPDAPPGGAWAGRRRGWSAGVAADAVDAQLAVELEMRPQGVARIAHPRAPSSGTT